MTIAEKVLARLNAADTVEFGLSNGDAHLVGDCINFTYAAPVLGGACKGVVHVYDDGRIYDGTSDQEFVSYAPWVRDLESMME